MRLLLAAGLFTVLLLGLWAYGRPAFIVGLGNTIASCF
jgi:hypothetical protein